MDSNYVYQIASHPNFQNAGGDFWRGIGDSFKNIGKGGGGGGDGGGGDGQGAKWITAGLGILGTWLGTRGQNQPPQQQQPPPPPPPKKNNTALYLVGGVAVIGIGLAIFFAVRKK